MGKTENTSAETKGRWAPDRGLDVEDPLLNKWEVAELLGVTVRWVSRGYLPRVVLGPQQIRYRQSEVLAYIKAQSQPARKG